MTALDPDRLTAMTLRSVRSYLADRLATDYAGVWLAGPDFDHRTRGDSSRRVPPYVTLVSTSERTASLVLGGRRLKRSIRFEVWVVCESYLATLARPQQVQQILLAARTDGVAGAVPLVDADLEPPAAVGRVALHTGDIYPIREAREELPHTSVIACRADLAKKPEASLLE